MKKKLTARQMINEELATRSYNHKFKEVLKNHSPKEEQKDLVVDFKCECSDDSCQATVPLTLKQYEKLHKNNASFVLAKGHQEPTIEKVTEKASHFVVVEKPALSNEAGLS